MVDEFELFKRNIRSITSMDFNTSHSLIGTIVNYTPDMRFCDVEVEMKGGRHTFANIPAHGYPVKGSSAIIHFHDGHPEQPFCDCEYRMNPPDDVIMESLTTHCYNWVDNGDFYYGTEGFTGENGSEGIVLTDDCYTSKGKGCVLPENGSFIEFEVDLTACRTKYFKFQCFYRGLDWLKVECYNTDTNEIIQNLPYTMARDYKIWTSPFGRFKWAYNKETYPFLTKETTLNEHILMRLTNYKTPDNIKSYTRENSQGELEEVTPPHSVEVDGLLVYSENGDTKYYNSENDMIQYHDLHVD
ncbi:MAG: hypothetical protein BZ138_07260 [Methanosphaera sp. rholeuAM270]|nr:MAG: hypothetical protein BZ138_07260 [Methanosphaera sp. rholeuAM270]